MLHTSVDNRHGTIPLQASNANHRGSISIGWALAVGYESNGFDPRASDTTAWSRCSIPSAKRPPGGKTLPREEQSEPSDENWRVLS